MGNEQPVTVRVRMPKNGEVLGEIEEILGASRFRVNCKDGNERTCRIPGKIRRRVRLSVGDIVLVKPWDIEANEKGDIIWMYTRTQAKWLRNRGFI